MQFFIILLLLFNSAHPLAAQETPDSQSSIENTKILKSDTKELRILSWNIYMLPRFARFTGKIPRAKAIPEELLKEDYDIIVFQEAFHVMARRILWRKLKEEYPYQVGPINRNPLPVKTHSGIWIVSKIPLKKVASIEFENCEGPDCWAGKGALLAEGEWQGQQFQIMGTHIQAGGSARASEIKLEQVAEIANKLLEPNKREGVPQILGGDYNISINPAERYDYMLSTLKAADGLCSGREFSCDGENDFRRNGSKRTVDFIFYRDNGAAPATIKRSIKAFTSPWRDGYKDLSDHYAVEAVIRFNTLQP